MLLLTLEGFSTCMKYQSDTDWQTGEFKNEVIMPVSIAGNSQTA